MGGNGATKSGKTWLSACGPPVEMPMTIHSGLGTDADVVVTAGPGGRPCDLRFEELMPAEGELS